MSLGAIIGLVHGAKTGDRKWGRAGGGRAGCDWAQVQLGRGAWVMASVEVLPYYFHFLSMPGTQQAHHMCSMN